MKNRSALPYKIGRTWSGEIEVETRGAFNRYSPGDLGFGGWDRLLKDAEHGIAEGYEEDLQNSREAAETDLLELYDREMQSIGLVPAHLRFHARTTSLFVTRLRRLFRKIFPSLRPRRYREAYFMWIAKAD